jgi:hypothetical protein
LSLVPRQRARTRIDRGSPFRSHSKHSATMKVNVKWSKELYQDIEVDMDEPPEVFKIQLHSLTGVPVHQQKVMGKGGMLANDQWGKVTLKEGMTVMMLGTAEKQPDVAETAAAPQFIEDLPEEVRRRCDPPAPFPPRWQEMTCVGIIRI